MGFLWDFFVVPMLFPCGISMIFLWDFCGMSIESKLKPIEHEFKLSRNQLKVR